MCICGLFAAIKSSILLGMGQGLTQQRSCGTNVPRRNSGRQLGAHARQAELHGCGTVFSPAASPPNSFILLRQVVNQFPPLAKQRTNVFHYVRLKVGFASFPPLNASNSDFQGIGHLGHSPLFTE